MAAFYTKKQKGVFNMKKNKVWIIALITVIGFVMAGCSTDSDDDNPTPIPIEMVWIPGGSFQMGNPDSSIGYDDERPVHTVTLTGFYMGKYQVTQAQYQAVMGYNPSYFDYDADSENHPVEQVSWYNALVFCNKLSMAEGLSPAYRIENSTNPADWGDYWDYDWDAVEVVSGSRGYRLPTEAQWEYAAKGGNGSPGNYIYAGSNDSDEVAWYPYDNSGYETHEVGKKAPNGLGLYDMSGNVWEWCWDWYDYYSDKTQTNPTVPASPVSGAGRVLRGGSWFHSAECLRSVFRNAYDPNNRDHCSGFRLVRP
jgi:formylglycine-generating enzyme required for sulfatase activity